MGGRNIQYDSMPFQAARKIDGGRQQPIDLLAFYLGGGPETRMATWGG
jgi:hypothetical protein